MKNYELKLMAWLILALLISVPTFAWEHPRNPDRFPSIGLRIENHKLGGNYAAVSNPNGVSLIERGSVDDDGTGLGANLRLPVNSGLTLDFDYMTIDGEKVISRNNNIYRSNENLDGYRMGIGIRLYLNK